MSFYFFLSIEREKNKPSPKPPPSYQEAEVSSSYEFNDRGRFPLEEVISGTSWLHAPFRPITSWLHAHHPEILIDCPSGFTFHFSLAFLGFSSIFLGFLFHLAEVYSRFYYCFADTALCRNTNVLICMLARRMPEISFLSNSRSWCESDYWPIEDNTFLLPRLSGFPHSLCYFGRLPDVTKSCSSSVTLGVNLSFCNGLSFISKV